MSVTSEERTRWSDLRALLSQGKTLPAADYAWYCRMKLTMNNANKRGLRNTCYKGPPRAGVGATARPRKDLKEYREKHLCV
jgi:hypothetical protein